MSTPRRIKKAAFNAATMKAARLLGQAGIAVEQAQMIAGKKDAMELRRIYLDCIGHASALGRMEHLSR